MMNPKQFFPRQVVESGGNRWDWALLPLFLALLTMLAYGASQMARPYAIGEQLPLSLDPVWLPYYLMRTTLRMFLALGASLIFSCIFAALAAKYRVAEKVLVPALDILQSIPILGFLSITVTGFIALFPGNLLGVECAAIFAIFTSQAWNMAFSLYQSLKTVPGELEEASRIFHLIALAAFLAARAALRDAGAAVEHDDVDVRRLVLRRRLGSDHGRQFHRHPARRRLLCRARDPAARPRRDRLCAAHDVAGDHRL